MFDDDGRSTLKHLTEFETLTIWVVYDDLKSFTDVLSVSEARGTAEKSFFEIEL